MRSRFQPGSHSTRTAAILAVALCATLFFAAPGVSARQTAVPQKLVVSVHVVDKHDTPLTDLAPTEFEVKENGQSRTILRAELDRRPLAVALVVDSNGALSTGYLQNVVPAGVAVLKQLPPGTTVDVWATGDWPTHVATGVSDMGAAEAALKSIAASGTNALLDTIAQASQALPSGEDCRTAVIVLTSGGLGDNGSRGVAEALKVTSMRPTFVGLEMIIGEQDGRVESELTYLAESTRRGGTDGCCRPGR